MVPVLLTTAGTCWYHLVPGTLVPAVPYQQQVLWYHTILVRTEPYQQVVAVKYHTSRYGNSNKGMHTNKQDRKHNQHIAIPDTTNQ